MQEKIKLQLQKDSRIAILLGVLVILFFGNSLSNGYSIDDQYVYTENELVTDGLSNWKKIFTESSFHYPTASFGYRPIPMVSFAIENELFGINPLASHFINILLYFLSAFLFYKVLKRLFPLEGKWLALLTTILFIIHPIHTEIVNNIKCRDELLMLLFGLLACLFWLLNDKQWLNKSLALLFLTISFLSKKTGFIFIGVLPLISFFNSKGNWKKSAFSLFSMIAPLVIWKVMKRNLIHSKDDVTYLDIENPLYGDSIPHEKLVIVLESLWFYVKSLLLPLQFSAYYGYKTLEVQDFRVVTALGVLLILLIVFLSIWKLKKQSPISFASILLLGGIFPFLNIHVPAVGIVAERFITIASLGWCVLLIYGVAHFVSPKRRKIALLLGGVFFLYSFVTVTNRNKDWESENTVLEAGLKIYPNSVTMNKVLATNYGRELRSNKLVKNRKEKLIKMLEMSERVIKYNPNKTSFVNLGNLKLRMQKNAKAATIDFKKAIALDKQFVPAYIGLASAYEALGSVDNAIQVYQKIIALEEGNKNAYSSIIQLYSKIKQYRKALEWNIKAYQTFPNDHNLLINEGNLYNRLGEKEKAIVAYSKYAQIDTANPSVIKRLEELKREVATQNSVNK